MTKNQNALNEIERKRLWYGLTVWIIAAFVLPLIYYVCFNSNIAMPSGLIGLLADWFPIFDIVSEKFEGEELIRYQSSCVVTILSGVMFLMVGAFFVIKLRASKAVEDISAYSDIIKEGKVYVRHIFRQRKEAMIVMALLMVASAAVFLNMTLYSDKLILFIFFPAAPTAVVSAIFFFSRYLRSFEIEKHVMKECDDG